MTQEEIVKKFKNGTITGDELLNLPYTNQRDAGRVLLEIYYYLLDVNEERAFNEVETPVPKEKWRETIDKAKICTDRAIATALREIWFEE